MWSSSRSVAPEHDAASPRLARRQWLARGAACFGYAGAAFSVAAFSTAAAAQRGTPSEIAAQWGSARLHGQGRLRFLGLHVYDIRLWTVEPAIGPEDWPRKPLALEIEYARDLVGRLIAERSLKEMQRAGTLDESASQRWLNTMNTLFPDVKAGDRITGVHLPGGLARFFHNGQVRGEVRDPEFARRFFGIWLADHTSEPGLRAQLLGRP